MSDTEPCFPEEKINIFNTFISRLQLLKNGINNITENNKKFLGTIKDRINSLIDKIKDINKRISNINNEINGYKNEINKLTTEKNDCIKKLEELTNKQSEYTSKIEELEIQVNENKNIINEIEKMRKKNERCKEESTKLMNQIDSINAEILDNTTYVETLDKSSKEIGDELKLATDNLEAEVNNINNDPNSGQMQLQSQPIPIIIPPGQPVQIPVQIQPFTEFTIPGNAYPTSYNDIISELNRKSSQITNPNNKYAVALKLLNKPNMTQDQIADVLRGTYNKGKIIGGKSKKQKNNKTKKITRKRIRRKTQKGGYVALYPTNKRRRTSSARSSKRSSKNF